MSDQTHRSEFIANLRALADFLEANDTLPVPYSTYVTHYPSTLDEARTARKGTNGWIKENDKNSAYVTYARRFGGDEYGYGTVGYEMTVSKRNSCKRVQVGTTHVEAVPEHDEPVYEWDCADEADEADEADARYALYGTSTGMYGDEADEATPEWITSLEIPAD
jgi:hypothetical protein